MAPVLLQTFQDPFAPSPVMGLATPASRQVYLLLAVTLPMQLNGFCVYSAIFGEKLWLVFWHCCNAVHLQAVRGTHMYMLHDAHTMNASHSALAGDVQ